MTINDWVRDSTNHIQEKGIRRGSIRSIFEFYLGIIRQLEEQKESGTPIYERNWDALVILDACRPDALEQLSDSFEFLPASIETMRSKASCSRIWMAKNFQEQFETEMLDTAHITSNPYSSRELWGDQFAVLDEVWRYAWDEKLGTVPARPITDRAIEIGREMPDRRLIIHYMQPHFPSVPKPLGSPIDLETFGREWHSVWNRLDTGEVSKSTVWDSYIANLEYVLKDISILLENIGREKVVLTADHGNAFGEYGVYGHPPKTPIRQLRTVPWVELTGHDQQSYTPDVTPPKTLSENEVESRLRALGYKE